MPLSFGRSGAAWAALAAGPILLAGCGGGGGGSVTGNTSTARLRVVDAAPNAGTSNVLANGASAYGDLQYFQTGGSSANPASPYLYIQPQGGVPFTYQAGVALPSNSQTVTNNYDINQGNHYTAFLIGRSDTFSSSPFDPRFLQVVVPAQQNGPSASQATLRVLNAAPDLGFVPSNGTSSPVVGSVNVTVGAPATASFNGIAYATTSSYQTLPSGGGLPVTVTLAGGNGTPVATSTTTIGLSNNTVYTLVLAESNVSPPTYDLRLLSE